MRVTSVEMFTSTLEEPISFSLRDDEPRSRYKIRNMLGLDAEDIVPKFYGWGLNAQSNAEDRFYSLRMKSREVVMHVILNPQFQFGESYSDVRDNLYRSISATRGGVVDLQFKNGPTVVSHLQGLITKFEATHFTKLPEVQITISCEDPLFRAINPVTFEDDELPTTNPLLIPDSLSTAPHGFEMDLTFSSASTHLTIQDEASNPNWQFVITPAGGFLNGDILYFSSEYSNKYLYIDRSNTIINLIDKVSPASIWPILFPGANTFYLDDMTKFDLNEVSFYAAYWGV